MTFIAHRDHCQAGMSMVELIVASSILAIIISGAVGLFAYNSKQREQQVIIDARNRLYDQLRRAATTPQNLRNSVNFALDGSLASTNQPLAACLDPSHAGTCTATASQGFSLVGLNLLPSGGFERLAGPATAPIRYQKNGERCSLAEQTNTSKCPIEALISFKGVCAGGAASCATAVAVSVQFAVREVAGANLLGTKGTSSVAGSQMQLASTSSNAASAQATAAVIQVAEVFKTSTQSCSANSVQVATRSDGKPVCSCKAGLYQQTGIDADGNPICGPVAFNCPTGQVMVGLENTGANQGRPRCAPLVNNGACWSVGPTVNDCGTNGFMVERRIVSYPNCYTVCDKWGCWVQCSGENLYRVGVCCARGF